MLFGILFITADFLFLGYVLYEFHYLPRKRANAREKELARRRREGNW
jgi:hypothetical protein